MPSKTLRLQSLIHDPSHVKRATAPQTLAKTVVAHFRARSRLISTTTIAKRYQAVLPTVLLLSSLVILSGSPDYGQLLQAGVLQ